MRINTKLKAISWGTGVVVILMIPTLLWAFLEFNQTKSNYLLAESINRQYIKSNSLRNQYFLYYNQYVLEQLDAKKTADEVLLQRARKQFTDKENLQLLQQLPKHIEKVNKIFDRTVKNYSLMVISNAEQRSIYAELEKRLISQLLLKASEIEQILFNVLNNATTRIQKDYEKLVIITIVFTALLASTIIIVMTQLGRMISRRLVHLHRGARVVANGNLNYRIDDKGSDEFSELAQSINFMTGNLQLFTQKLESEIHMRKITEEKLIEAKMTAEIANSAKSQFLSRMSHELRTPLNAILGFSQLQQMEFTKDTPDDTRTNTDQVYQAGQHLLMLVDDIMDIVRIEQSQLTIPLEELGVSEAIKESISLIQLQAKMNEVKLIIEPTQLYITANHHRLKQVLVNLLSNAIKYNTKGGSVSIQALEVQPEEIEIRITDTGVGINVSDYEAVFEPFTRLKYAEEHEVQGVGIGLALSKFLVVQMKGKIGLYSELSKGTTFWIRFSKGKTVASNLIDSQVSHSMKAKKAIVHTILYIEDNPTSRHLFERFLQNYPEVTLFTANTAEEGINIAKEEVPSLIFIDINLPKMNGNKALEILRLLPNLNNTRMFALSADALPKQVEKTMNSGFDEYLTKPVSLELVAKIIEA